MATQSSDLLQFALLGSYNIPDMPLLPASGNPISLHTIITVAVYLNQLPEKERSGTFCQENL